MLKEYSPIKIETDAKEPIYEDYKINLQIADILEARGIKKLYKFQKESIEKIKAGKNLFIMAPTAAGKTECYLIPVIEAALKNQRSILIYPTKALASDQLNRFKEFSILGIKTEVYDGDTPQHIRQKIRQNLPHCLISNFDMLHHILINNRLWGDFFAKIKYIVIDEAHTYCGVFGSHVANIIWRLERIAKKFGNNNIQYILCSATIGNPKDFCNYLFDDKDFEIILAEGSPQAKIIHYIVNYEDESIISSAIKIAKELNKKTIIFGNSHSVVERIGYYSKEFDYPIKVYRAGLDITERKKIENGFNNGEIKCIAATSALELGVDIKDAQVCILAGFPGSITKTKQRMGRVGRKGQTSEVVFIAKQSPLDQYYATNPQEYLYGLAENSYANKYNENIRKIQLLCAAKDFPLNINELKNTDMELIEKLREEGYMQRFKDLFFSTKKANKLIRELSIRGTNKKIEIYDANTKKYLGEREISLAIGELYTGAIYLIGAKRYSVEKFDLEKRQAFVSELKEQEDLPIYTQALKQKDVDIIEEVTKTKIRDIEICYGKVYVENFVDKYAIKNIYTNQTISIHSLATPLSYSYKTYGFWVDLSEYIDFDQDFADGLHALEHITISLMPAISGMEQNEIGGISYPTGKIIYYEGIEDGSGALLPIIKNYEYCLKMSLDRLLKCKCLNGCPKCIYSPQCGNDNKYLNKDKAIEIAKKILKI
jgi:DEAD/DEAH box helicase domain-containing protein